MNDYVSPLLAELDGPLAELGYSREPNTNRWEKQVVPARWTIEVERARELVGV